MSNITVEAPPVREGEITPLWESWFNRVFRRFQMTEPSVSTDNGNASVTLIAGKNAKTQIFNTPLTAGRTVTLSTTDVFTGAYFRIVRRAGATGAFNIDVGGIKTLTAAGQWVDVEFDGSVWIVTAYGSL